MVKMLSLAREALINISKKKVLLNTALADMIKISPYYAELICRSLSKDEYIVIDSDGKCEVTSQGRHFLNGDNTRT
jgi:Mn-dependent DtxR family transcriptional regulator